MYKYYHNKKNRKDKRYIFKYCNHLAAAIYRGMLNDKSTIHKMMVLFAIHFEEAFDYLK